MPIRTVQAVFPDARNVLIYSKTREGRRQEARQDIETILRGLRGLLRGLLRGVPSVLLPALGVECESFCYAVPFHQRWSPPGCSALF